MNHILVAGTGKTGLDIGLLLPLQNEIFRLFRRGMSIEGVEELSHNPLLLFNHIKFLKNIGLTTLSKSVDNYVSRMSPDYKTSFSEITKGLKPLAETGRSPFSQRSNIPDNSLYYKELSDEMVFLFIISAGHLSGITR